MQLDGTKFDCLSHMTVNLDGEWSALPKRDWRGTAIADESLVAVAFLSVNGRIEWAKSDRNQLDGFGVRLGLYHYDSTGRDVQIAFSLAQGGRRCRSNVSSPDYVPEIFTARQLQTGVIHSFAAIDGNPTIHVFALFLARSNVRSQRNGLWRVRDDLANSLPDRFRDMMTYGRTGTLDTE